MATYRQQLKLIVWLYLAITSVVEAQKDGGHHQEVDSLHRSKRTLTTICVEIKPSGPQEEPYYMCKGADFRGGGGQQEPPSYPQQPPPINAQPVYQQISPIATFPSFPAFAGGFLPVQPAYEDLSKVTQTQSTPYQEQPQPHHQHQPQSQSGTSAEQYSAPAPPASPTQSYGLPTVPYTGPRSSSAVAHGTAAGSGPAATPITYNPAAVKKPPSTVEVPTSKSTSPSYESPGLGSRYRPGLDEDVLALPSAGFQMEELNQQYRRPFREQHPQQHPQHQPQQQPQQHPQQQPQQQQPQQPQQHPQQHPQQPQQPMIWLPQPQPQPVLGTPAMSDHQDDPVMRAFYSSLQPPAPVLGAAQQMGAAPQITESLDVPGPIPVEHTLGQPLQSYTPNYGPTLASGGPPSFPPPPPSYDPYSNVCNSPPSPVRQCPTAASENYASNSCPSFQPVIIAMPCFGQQRPTHYLAMPNPSPDNMVGSPLGFGSFGMTPQMGNHFAMQPQMVQPGFPMNSMANQQVGSPFGLAPVLNPFGPLGTLNPFNPFNRLLGAPAPTTPQPSKGLLQRLFGYGGSEETSTTTDPTVGSVSSTASQSSSTTTMTTPSSEQPDVNVGASLDSEETDDEAEDEEDGDEGVVGSATTTEASAEANASKSLDSSELTAQQYVDKATDKLKNDKRKRHNNFRSSSLNNSNSQKRKYLQQL